ncbi:Wzz/FepE/Etk N-terminal domain-containing protein [Paraglaciecola polaris]|uniref:Lipopolysaccharide biosynthesis protein n=1 Tax=Paraglaciecola polaris LMG 21857 TaxID=1129793 RepID=K7ADP9_9ALTE|nr:Wzz/FepE/Etk N-terminal domain-containing protein [Paraglaciecola polaris]GAC33445.1 lipopolysaccharide biosynthesis protein [Paraglaciecola polaris LMG 21857]
MTDIQNNSSTNDKVQYVTISPDMLQAQNNDDEIDLRELWNVIWSGKWIIITVTAIFAVASVLYALSLPNIYKSEALLAPADAEQQGGLAGLAGQFGGLASLAGVSLGGAKSDKTGMAIEILKSREFFARFAQKHNILPDLMAAKGWDLSSNTIIYDEELYSYDKDEWLRDMKPPRQPKPSMQEANIEFTKLFSVEQSKDSGMVNISLEHYSPYIAKQWVDWLINDINLVMKFRDKKEAERSISYLESQIGKTNIVEQKTLLFQLIEEQAKTLMFAEVRDEYVFKTIDPALVPEIKFKPKRALIVLLGIFLGVLLSVFFVLIKHLRKTFEAYSK